MHQIIVQDLMVLTDVIFHIRVFGYYCLCLNMKKEKKKLFSPTIFPCKVEPCIICISNLQFSFQVFLFLTPQLSILAVTH